MKRVGRAPTLTHNAPTVASHPYVGTADPSIADTGSIGANAIASGMHESGKVPRRYPFRMSMYADPPNYDITIEEFEELALARLELLRAVETATIRNLKDDELISYIRKIEAKFLPMHANNVASAYPLFEERRRDQASHYILRLAFCSNPDAIRWLVTQECVLLKLRFLSDTVKDRNDFLRSVNADHVLLSATEKESLSETLKKATTGLRDFATEEFFKVPFEQVPDLIGRRAVLIVDGWAYVPRCESLSIVLTKFRDTLEAQLERTAKELPVIRDDRLLPLLDALKRSDPSSNADSSNSATDALTAAQIDKAVVHFPPCMSHLHRKLRQESHLRYGGRQQYGLFLKSIGVSLEEALLFWRRSFAAKHTDDSFNKNYAYNVRHNYGKEGKRANYTSYSCQKIITGSAPATGDHHGCPFRHFGTESLGGMLTTYVAPNGSRLNPAQVREISDLVKGHHYQLACTRLFECTRKMDAPMETITFPSKFYETSVLSSSAAK